MNEAIIQRGVSMQNAGYLFAAFTIIWALVFGYVLFLVRKQSTLNRQIELLKDSTKEGKGKE